MLVFSSSSCVCSFKNVPVCCVFSFCVCCLCVFDVCEKGQTTLRKRERETDDIKDKVNDRVCETERSGR